MSDADPAATETSPARRSTHVRTCPLCEATCGLELTLEHHSDDDPGTVVLVRGDRDDVFSHGYLCAKGSAIGRLHDDPDRLRAPLIRRGTPDDPQFEQVTWDEAFAEVERLLTPVLDDHGRNAVALYLGNPNVHNPGAALYTRPLVRALGTNNLFSASTVDQMPRHVSSGLMFGSPDAIAVPDLDRTDYLLMLGANPLESNGSLCTAPDFAGRLKAISGSVAARWWWSTRDAPAPPTSPTSTCPSARAPTPPCWPGSSTSCSWPTPWIPVPWPTTSTASTSWPPTWPRSPPSGLPR